MRRKTDESLEPFRLDAPAGEEIGNHLWLPKPQAVELHARMIGRWEGAVLPQADGTSSYTWMADAAGAAYRMSLQIAPVAPVPVPGPVPVRLGTLALPVGPSPAGTLLQGQVSLTAPAPAGGVVVSLSSSDPPTAGVPPWVIVPAGLVWAPFAIQTQRPATDTVIMIVATLDLQAAAGNLTVKGTPVPVPPPVTNVRALGAKADGVTNDAPAIQKVLDAAKPGDTIYFPAGDYFLGAVSFGSACLFVKQRQLTLTGDGAATRLLHGRNKGFWVGGMSLPAPGTVIRRMTLVGLPGKYYADGNVDHAILLDGSDDCTVEDVTLVGPGNGIYSVNDSKGMTVRRVTIQGWGSVGLGLYTGAQVTDCILLQDDPDLNSGRSKHGIYIHNGAKNVVILRTRVENARAFGLQIYGEQVGFVTGPITVQDSRFVNCFAAMICANYPADAARVQGLLVRGNTFSGSYAGIAVAIRQGDGVTFEDNAIDGGFQGLAIGQWGPNDPSGVLRQAVFRNNQIKNCQYGLYALASNGGRFEGCVIGPGNTFTNCLRPQIDEPSAGLTVVV